MDRFTLSANTLSKTVKDNPADRIEVEIGDSKQPDFKPQFKIKRWDNEVNFSMRAIEEAGATMVEKDGKVKYKGKDIEVHQYEKTEAGEDGGFEFEWVLNKKPKSNVLRTTIQHKGLDFFYQPALTAEEIEQGASRDENVVGSYAVYRSTKPNNIVGGMEYQIGKAFHIYRPHAVDADGVKVWCELDIKEGELTVTVPEDFLNKASYPVVVDPTFGYTSVGGSTTDTGVATVGNGQIGSHFNLSEAGDVSKLTAYVRYQRGDSNAEPDRSAGSDMSIHTKTGDPAGTFVSSTPGSNTTAYDDYDGGASLSAAWRDYSFSTDVSLTSGDYWIVFGGVYGDSNGTDSKYTLRYDSSVSDKSFLGVGSSGIVTSTTWDSTWSLSQYFGHARVYSMYATYTASSSYNPAFAHRRLLL